MEHFADAPCFLCERALPSTLAESARNRVCTILACSCGNKRRNVESTDDPSSLFYRRPFHSSTLIDSAFRNTRPVLVAAHSRDTA